MLSKRTIIGLVVGIAIISIGGYSLLTHIGMITINEDYVVGVGDSMSYTIPAPASTPQHMKIIGDSFDMKLQSPGDGLQIPITSHKKETTIDWTHLVDGETRIQIQNTGESELEITGILIRSSDKGF
jgi:hypothetical protein